MYMKKTILVFRQNVYADYNRISEDTVLKWAKNVPQSFGDGVSKTRRFQFLKA